MTANQKTFGDWLKPERKRKNLTPAKLAQLAGVKPQYVYNLENNVPTRNGAPPRPSPDKCANFARALGVHYLEAYAAAGYVPDEISEEEVEVQMAADYFASLPPDKRAEELSHLKFLYENFGDADKLRSRSPKHPAVVREGEEAPEPIARTTPQVKAQPASPRETPRDKAHSEQTDKKRGQNGS